MPVLTHGVVARTFYSPACCCCLLLLLLLAETCSSSLDPKRWCKTSNRGWGGGSKNVEKMTPPFFGSKIMNLLVFFDFEPKKCFRVPTP